jgi:hypothetical protein
VFESAEYRKLSPQSDYAEAAERVVFDPLAWYSGSGSNLETNAGSAFKPWSSAPRSRSRAWPRSATTSSAVSRRRRPYDLGDAVTHRPGRTRERTARRRRATRGRAGSRWSSPRRSSLLFVLFLFWPVLSALRTSLFDESLSAAARWAGLNNYTELLHDPDFWAAMWHTALLHAAQRAAAGRAAARPGAAGHASEAGCSGCSGSRSSRRSCCRLRRRADLELAVQPGFGLINSYLTSLGFAEVNWLGQPGVAMISAVIVTLWWTFGFNFILYLAGLQEIPRELYEAAATTARRRAAAAPHHAAAALLDGRARDRPPDHRVAEDLRPGLPAAARRAGPGELDATRPSNTSTRRASRSTGSATRARCRSCSSSP